MRKLTAIFLASVITAQAFFNVGVAGYWLLNHAEIAATLCENKDKPDLHCDGKCYLKKKIAETPDNAPANGSPKPLTLKKGIELAEILQEIPTLLRPIFLADRPVLISGQRDLYHFSAEKSIFHPPPFCTTA